MRVVRDPVCGTCRKKLGPATPRVFYGGKWWCARCLYLREHGPMEQPLPRKRLPKLGEPLFP